MDAFVAVELSPSRRPVLLQDEVETLIQSHVSIYVGYVKKYGNNRLKIIREHKTEYQGGIASITSYRIIWLDPSSKLNPIGLALANIGNAEPYVPHPFHLQH